MLKNKWQKTNSQYNEKGFTIPELIVVMAVFAILATLAIINVVGIKQRTSLDTSVNILISDLKQQQLKAMFGDTEGRGSRDNYGIHFVTDEYTLFHGNSYNAASPGNFTVNLGDNVTFAGANDIIFTQISGEINSGNETIVIIENTTQEQRNINLNKFGVITSVE